MTFYHPFFSKLTPKFFAPVFLMGILMLHPCTRAASHASEEEVLDRMEKSVVYLHLAACSPDPNFLLYKKDMETNGHSTIVKLANVAYGVRKRTHGGTSVSISQNHNSCLKTPLRELESAGPVTLHHLRPYLGIVEKTEYIEFLQHYHLSLHQPAVPLPVADSYIGIEKEYLKSLIEVHAHHPESVFVVLGGPTTSLIALTLKILAPAVKCRLVLCGEIPRYVHDLLYGVKIDYVHKPNVLSGYPHIVQNFKHRYKVL